jgi:transcriptional regulator with XRE-family HTH domain
MPKTLHSARHLLLVELVASARKRAGLSQAQVARALGRHQPFIATLESGQRRIDVVELIELAEAIGFDPSRLLKKVQKVT